MSIALCSIMMSCFFKGNDAAPSFGPFGVSAIVQMSCYHGKPIPEYMYKFFSAIMYILRLKWHYFAPFLYATLSFLYFLTEVNGSLLTRDLSEVECLQTESGLVFQKFN